MKPKQEILRRVYLVLVCTSAVICASPDKISKRVWTKLGHSLDMSCISLPNRSIEYCRWDRISPLEKRALGIFLNFNLTATTTPIPGYAVNQTALLYGECGIKIESVAPGDVTFWNCTVIDTQNRKPYLGSVEVVLTKKPTAPQILDKEQFQTIVDFENGSGNSTLNVTCCAKNGVPSPVLTLSFGNKSVTTSGNELGSNDCLEWSMVKFNWTDNDSRLICKAEHVEYVISGTEACDITEDFVDLNVSYPPKILKPVDIMNGSIFTLLADPLNNTVISVTFSANPIASVEWFFDRNSSLFNFTKIVHEEISEWSSATVLTVNTSNMSPGSSEKFRLEIFNPFGTKVFYFEIIRSAAGSQSDDLPTWMWLFIIIIGAVVSQILLVLCVFICRRKAWFCFAGRAGRFSTRGRVRGSPKNNKAKLAANRTNKKSKNGEEGPMLEISAPLMNAETGRPIVPLKGTSRFGNSEELREIEYDWQYPLDSIQRESLGEPGSSGSGAAADFRKVQVEVHAVGQTKV